MLPEPCGLVPHVFLWSLQGVRCTLMYPFAVFFLSFRLFPAAFPFYAVLFLRIIKLLWGFPSSPCGFPSRPRRLSLNAKRGFVITTNPLGTGIIFSSLSKYIDIISDLADQDSVRLSSGCCSCTGRKGPDSWVPVLVAVRAGAVAASSDVRDRQRNQVFRQETKYSACHYQYCYA